eukprot:COSAG01_NODE_4327_length_5128_cov_23.227833_1_plen_106_part_00
MGSQKCRSVGKYQSVLIVIHPMISTRPRRRWSPSAVACGLWFGFFCAARQKRFGSIRHRHRGSGVSPTCGGRWQVKIADMGLSKKLEECARHLLATATQYAIHFD